MAGTMDQKLEERFKGNSERLVKLNKDCSEARENLRQAETRRNELKSKYESLSSFDSDHLFFQLKLKYESFKGSLTGETILNIIKATQQFKTQSLALSVLRNEKQAALEKYKEVSRGAYPLRVLEEKLKSLKKIIEEREKSSSVLKEVLVSAREKHRKLREELDTSQVRKDLAMAEILQKEIEKTQWDCKCLALDQTQVLQSIDAETLLAKSKPEEIREILKSRVSDLRLALKKTTNEIRDRERKLAKIKIFRNRKKCLSEISFFLRICRSERSLSIGPRGLLSPDRKSRQSLARNGVPSRASIKEMPQSVAESLSLTSRILLSNRGYLINS